VSGDERDAQRGRYGSPTASPRSLGTPGRASTTARMPASAQAIARALAAELAPVQRSPGAPPAAAPRPSAPPRTADGHPIQPGDVLVGSPPPQVRQPDITEDLGPRPPLNPYEGDATSSPRSIPVFDASGPGRDDPEQGTLGDCYLIASLSAIAQSDPDRIRRMVADLGNGRYRVRFWVAQREGSEQTLTFSHHDEFVTAAFPAAGFGAPSYGGAPQQREIWVSLVERAYAQWHGGYAQIGAGGNPGDTMSELTGVASQRLWSSQLDADALVVQIARAIQAGHPVCASSTADAGVAARHGVFPSHGYTVVAADAGAHTVTVRNPHRSSAESLMPECVMSAQDFHDAFVLTDVSMA
jgi:Calpain family cysteine protease